MKQKGFTLVELAIVLMIIGLLIGGILKGQELIQNARITSLIRQFKSYDAAAITFHDSYGGKPGDISFAATRLPNCGSAPCSNSGNDNGIIGNNSTVTAENSTFWVHLAAANLILGIDPALYDATVASAMVPISLGGYAHVLHYSTAASASFVNGIYGHHWLFRNPGSGAAAYSIPLNVIGRVDVKMDDGKPWTGHVSNAGTCGIANGATEYPATTDLCSFFIKTSF